MHTALQTNMSRDLHTTSEGEEGVDQAPTLLLHGQNLPVELDLTAGLDLVLARHQALGQQPPGLEELRRHSIRFLPQDVPPYSWIRSNLQ